MSNIIEKLLIENHAKSIQIPHLVHFTRIKNLESILEHGIIPRKELESLSEIKWLANDTKRLDDCLGASSLSITYPNIKLFQRFQFDYPQDLWCILLLSSTILWKKDCSFCKHNAADTKTRKWNQRNSSFLKTSKAFKNMFVRNSEAQNEYRLFQTTDPQAEVLVFEKIEPELITSIITDNKKVADILKEHFSDKEIFDLSQDKQARNNFGWMS